MVALSLLAMAGSLWIAQAADATDLIVGRAIVGVGCAASFMSVVFLCSRWYAPARLATALSWVFAASNMIGDFNICGHGLRLNGFDILGLEKLRILSISYIGPRQIG